MTESSNFSMKELYEVSLKATYPMEFKGRNIAIGETIAFFDKIQLANFNEIKSYVTANGGWDNRAHVFWETTKDVQLRFTQGVFSKAQLALMTGAKLIDGKKELVQISQRELKESDENGKIILKNIPTTQPFVYDINGNSISYERKDNEITINEPYKELVIDYTYLYDNNTEVLVVGQRLIEGFLELEGKTRIKDDVTGKTKTGIIKIPKLKLMSELSMKLGQNATPLVGTFEALACPTGPRGNTVAMKLIFLDDDIDSDI